MCEVSEQIFFGINLEKRYYVGYICSQNLDRCVANFHISYTHVTRPILFVMADGRQNLSFYEIPPSGYFAFFARGSLHSKNFTSWVSRW